MVQGCRFRSARNAVQNAFMAVAKHIGQIQEPDSQETISYLSRTVKNMSFNLLNSRNRRANAERPFEEEIYMDDTQSDDENLPEKEVPDTVLFG